MQERATPQSAVVDLHVPVTGAVYRDVGLFEESRIGALQPALRDLPSALACSPRVPGSAIG